MDQESTADAGVTLFFTPLLLRLEPGTRFLLTWWHSRERDIGTPQFTVARLPTCLLFEFYSAAPGRYVLE